jgi:hypothetical protein
MADTSVSTQGRRSTRPTNADQHPGRVIQKRKRRTKEEIARDNEFLQNKRDEKWRQQTEGIERVAELEDQMAIDDANAESAHPRKSDSGQKRKKRAVLISSGNVTFMIANTY